MILPDVNLLIYAVDESSPLHEKSNNWWNGVLSSNEMVGLCYPSMLGFIRLSTNARVFDRPLSIDAAGSIVDGWLDQPNTTIVTPTDRHWPILKDLFYSANLTGNMTTDAHIAALAVEHGYTVYSNDADFGRFPTVRWVNPIA